MNEDEPRGSKGHCKQSGTGSWQSVITSGIFLSRCVRAHPVTHLYLYTESQDGPIPWPWAVPIPIFIACLVPVNRKRAGDLLVKLSSCKSEDSFRWLKVYNIGSDWCRITLPFWGGERVPSHQDEEPVVQLSLWYPWSIKPAVPSLFSCCHCFISQGCIFLSLVIHRESSETSMNYPSIFSLNSHELKHCSVSFVFYTMRHALWSYWDFNIFDILCSSYSIPYQDFPVVPFPRIPFSEKPIDLQLIL